MLAVVDLHRQRIDVRFKRVVGVRQGRQGVGQGDLRRATPPTRASVLFLKIQMIGIFI
jgi:hypothetical protein